MLGLRRGDEAAAAFAAQIALFHEPCDALAAHVLTAIAQLVVDARAAISLAAASVDAASVVAATAATTGATIEVAWRAGDKVRHRRFGEGVVVGRR